MRLRQVQSLLSVEYSAQRTVGMGKVVVEFNGPFQFPNRLSLSSPLKGYLPVPQQGQI